MSDKFIIDSFRTNQDGAEEITWDWMPEMQRVFNPQFNLVKRRWATHGPAACAKIRQEFDPRNGTFDRRFTRSELESLGLVEVPIEVEQKCTACGSVR
jgi:hypothetical protein